MSSALPPRPTPEEVEEALRGPSTSMKEVYLTQELLHLRAENESLRTEIAVLDNLETSRLHEARAEVAALRETLTAISRMDTSQTASPGLCAAVIHAMDALEWLEHRQPKPQPQPEPPRPRTVREWLETIPCPKWRAAALRNMNPKRADVLVMSWGACLDIAFEWSETPEGFKPWGALLIALESGAELPLYLRDNTPLPPCPFDGREGA